MKKLERHDISERPSKKKKFPRKCKDVDKTVSYSQGLTKVDHSGIDARIVLEQNKFTKKATCNRT